MKRLYETGGNVLAGVGIALCVLAAGVRLTGSHYVLGFEAATLFLGGTAVMVMACLAKLQLLLLAGGR